MPDIFTKEVILTILTNAGIPTVISLIALAFLWSYFKHVTLANVSTKFNSDLDRKLEEVKHSLSMKSKEHEIKYQKLHEKMSITLENLFTQLDNTNHAVRHLFCPNNIAHDPKHYIDASQRSVDELLKSNRQKALFIPTNVSTLIEEFAGISQSIIYRKGNACKNNNVGGDIFAHYNLLGDTELVTDQLLVKDKFDAIHEVLQNLLGLSTNQSPNEGGSHIRISSSKNTHDK